MENWAIAGYAASSSCVKITPDVEVTWQYEDALDTGRTMGQVSSPPLGCLHWYDTDDPTVHQLARRSAVHG